MNSARQIGSIYTQYIDRAATGLFNSQLLQHRCALYYIVSQSQESRLEMDVSPPTFQVRYDIIYEEAALLICKRDPRRMTPE